MFDPKSNIAEQLAHALKHHQQHQKDLDDKNLEIEKLRLVLAEYRKLADKEPSEET